MSDAEQRDIAEALCAKAEPRGNKGCDQAGRSEACGYGQKPIPFEEPAPVAQPSQHAQTRRVNGGVKLGRRPWHLVTH